MESSGKYDGDPLATMRKFVLFLFCAYVTALFFELIAHVLDPANKTFDNLIVGVIFFIFWYGFIYSLTFVVLKKQEAWVAGIIWAILGTLLELVLFKRLNIIVDPIVYFIMFIPTKELRRRFSSTN